MRHAIKFAFVFALAAGLAVTFPPVLGAAFADALLDFLDNEAVAKVMDYLSKTYVSRAVGIAALLLVWAGIVIAIDRAVDFVTRVQSTDNRV